MKSGNPALDKVERQAQAGELHVEGEIRRATVKGSFLRSAIFCLIVIASATATMIIFKNAFNAEDGSTLGVLFGIAALSGFPMLIMSFVISFNPKTAPVLGTIYCLLNGVFLGTISALFDLAYEGIVFLALMGTCVVFLLSLALFRVLGNRVSNKFTMGVLIALCSLLIVQLFGLILSLIFPALNVFFANFWVQLAVSALCIIIATVTIISNLNTIYRLEEYQMDKQYEWLAAFALTTSLVYLYVQILRLLAIIFARSSRN